MKKNTLPNEVLIKVIQGWARANGTNDNELEAWYNDDTFNGFKMSDYLTLDEYKAIWLEEDKKMDEFFKATDEEHKVTVFPYCPDCSKQMEDGDIGLCDGAIVLCDKCFI